MKRSSRNFVTDVPQSGRKQTLHFTREFGRKWA
jgi:hypothetical protein